MFPAKAAHFNRGLLAGWIVAVRMPINVVET
jgi:hypothetical protein